MDLASIYECWTYKFMYRGWLDIAMLEWSRGSNVHILDREAHMKYSIKRYEERGIVFEPMITDEYLSWLDLPV